MVFNANVPPSEHERMRAPFQEGSFPYPVKYGYTNVGLVTHGPDNWIGKTVFSLFPHQTVFAIPVSAVTAVPQDVPASRAILAANMETAVNTLWDAQPSIGDKISVIGAGVVGSLIAWLAAQIPGTDVELVDVNHRRETLAAHLNVTFKAPEDASPERDLIINASANEAGLNTALRCAGFEATIVEVSWYGNTPVTIPLGEAFHSRRLNIRSSQVGHIANPQRSRWDYKRRLELALSLLKHNCLDHLVSGESKFEDLPSTLLTITDKNADVLCHRIVYD